MCSWTFCCKPIVILKFVAERENNNLQLSRGQNILKAVAPFSRVHVQCVLPLSIFHCSALTSAFGVVYLVFLFISYVYVPFSSTYD